MTDRNPALAWSLTCLGGALFLLGVMRLLSGYAVACFPVLDCAGFAASSLPDPTPALLCLKLAGCFATAGWLLERYQVWQTPIHRGIRRAAHVLHAILTLPGDGVLELLLGGIVFIVLMLFGMVSLWSQTIR